MRFMRRACVQEVVPKHRISHEKRIAGSLCEYMAHLRYRLRKKIGGRTRASGPPLEGARMRHHSGHATCQLHPHATRTQHGSRVASPTLPDLTSRRCR